MPIESLREAIRLLARKPLLWVPGIVAGVLASVLWLLLNAAGAFFTSRLVVMAGLVLVLFISGMIIAIKEDLSDFGGFIRGGLRCYFRVLLPCLVINFMLMVIFILLVVTFGFIGESLDPGFIGLMTLVITIPTLMLTFFFDMAAVFEDRKVFESIQRSVALVSENTLSAIGFFITLAITCFAIFFALMFIWEIALYEKLAPLAEYNETQIQAFTYDQLSAMIGTDGIWVTAVVLFIGGLILVPLIFTFKACYFRKLAGSSPAQQITGEYDSKGRWYKY